MEALEVLKQQGYPLLFGTVLLDQLGVPFPTIPILLAAGALVGLGHLSAVPVFGLAFSAALLADLVWYALGRWRGQKMLSLLCQLSMEPDTCVLKTQNVFVRYGERCLLVAKFLPGLSTVTPPVAGLVRLPLARFAAWDSLGISLYLLVYFGLGAALRNQLEWLLEKIQAFGATLVQVALGVLLVHLSYKFINRTLFLRRVAAAGITPEELQEMMAAGQPVFIADLRAAHERQSDPRTLPGAMVISMEELPQRHAELPRDRDLVLFCS